MSRKASKTIKNIIQLGLNTKDKKTFSKFCTFYKKITKSSVNVLGCFISFLVGAVFKR